MNTARNVMIAALAIAMLGSTFLAGCATQPESGMEVASATNGKGQAKRCNTMNWLAQCSRSPLNQAQGSAE